MGSGYTNGLKVSDFNVPDLRGVFLRGVSGTTTNAPDKIVRMVPALGGNSGNNVESFQQDTNQSHAHGYADSTGHGQNGTAIDIVDAGGDDSIYKQDVSRTTSSTGGAESRPKNAYVHYIIKY